MLGTIRFLIVGIVMLFFVIGCEKETTVNYKSTPTFLSQDEEFIGIEGKVGFLKVNFIANEPLKTLWHFWGESDEMKGVVRVEGTHLETGEIKLY
ncbi:DUF4871 domain-containing protein [Bacillus pinisoli]|uniref:DUF4871 domain-containing protein n=1 Tax=Bacillus pinisoli TaxID=2901866 RepID=UPI001FF148D6|nr:DUF4871 domain-containing protein [Bacillus pinisoli]